MNMRDVITYICSLSDKKARTLMGEIISQDFQKLGIQDMGSFAKGGRYDVKKTILLQEANCKEILSIQAYEPKPAGKVPEMFKYGMIVATPNDNNRRLGDYHMIPVQGISFMGLFAIAIQLADKLNEKPRRKKASKKD